MALPVTTIVPFAQLPACAAACGPLFDANGACVPPAAATADDATYDACFCKYPVLQPFYTASEGVCAQGACAADPAGLGSIQGWFTSFCNGKAAVGGGAAGQTTAPATATDTTGTGASFTSTIGSTLTGIPNAPSNPGGSWLSSHYQWVIMLVILVVAIVGGWIGAAIWRKRYLRRRDRQYALGKRLAHQTASGRVVQNADVSNMNMPSAGMFQPAPIAAAGVYDEKRLSKPPKEKKRWIPTERT